MGTSFTPCWVSTYSEGHLPLCLLLHSSQTALSPVKRKMPEAISSCRFRPDKIRDTHGAFGGGAPGKPRAGHGRWEDLRVQKFPLPRDLTSVSLTFTPWSVWETALIFMMPPAIFFQSTRIKMSMSKMFQCQSFPPRSKIWHCTVYTGFLSVTGKPYEKLPLDRILKRIEAAFPHLHPPGRGSGRLCLKA